MPQLGPRFRPRVEEFEPRHAPAVIAGPLGGRYALGTPDGVTVYDANNQVVQTVTPFPGVPGVPRVTQADVTGDGVADLIVGTAPGTPAQVEVIDGRTGKLLNFWSPFEASFTGGVFVAAADVNGDGHADVIVSPDQGGGAVVAIYDGAKVATGAAGDAAELTRFLGINDPDFRGGARVAAGDVNGDGRPDVAVAAGAGGGPRVALYDGEGVLTAARRELVPDFFAFDSSLLNGIYVDIGDVNSDGRADLILGAGPGGGPRVLELSGRTLTAGGAAAALSAPLADFFAGDPSQRDGVSVTALAATASQPATIATVGGAGGNVQVLAPLPGAAPLSPPVVKPAAPAAASAPAVVPSAAAVSASPVLAFARAHLGRVVTAPLATGCTALIAQALTAAGARARPAPVNNGPIADHYVWGQLVYQRDRTGGYSDAGELANVHPGDIVQFDSYSEVRADDTIATAPHHTAVVETVNAASGEIGVIQQNWNDDPAARRGEFDLAGMTGGVVSIYHPVPAA